MIKPSPSAIAKSDVASLPARQFGPLGSARVLSSLRLLGTILDPLNGFSMWGTVQLGTSMWLASSTSQDVVHAHTRKPEQMIQAPA